MGALNSWGIYLIASATLILILSPVLASTGQDSREGADWRSVDGVREVIDSLRPGVIVNFSYGASSPADPIHLGGHSLSCSYGGGTILQKTRWALPNITISPTVRYDVWITGGLVKVTKVG